MKKNNLDKIQKIFNSVMPPSKVKKVTVKKIKKITDK